jgi:hypothetical protein
VFAIAGGGADIWNTADAFRYVSRWVNADMEIVARVVQIEDTHRYAKAGVMLREKFTADSAHVILDVKPDGGIEFMTRQVTGGLTSYVAGASVSLPVSVWLKLTRSGATVTGSFSTNGYTWTQVGSITTSMGPLARVGMAVTSHENTRVNHSRFQDVSVVEDVRPPPYDEIVIHASDTDPLLRNGSWREGFDPGSPDGVMLDQWNIGYSALSGPLAFPTHYMDVVFNADANKPYTIWLRLKAADNSKWNDSVWVQFSNDTVTRDGVPAYPIHTTKALLVNLATDSSASSLNGWGWANGAYWLSQPVTVRFVVPGHQTLRIQVREDGVALDQIVLSSDRYLKAPPGPPTDDHTIVPRVFSSTPPTAPAEPNPGDQAVGVSTAPTLTWMATGAASYDISFGPTNPPPFVHSKTTASYRPACECGEGVPRPLEYSTRYFWQITTRNANGSTPGPIWSFTTMADPSPPSSPFGPDPPNMAMVVSPSATVSWRAQNAKTFDVKFGTTNPPPPVSVGQTSASYSPGMMEEDTRYFWQVIANNANGSSPGPIWSFTTGPSTPPAPDAPSLPVPTDGATNVGASGTISWRGDDDATSYDVYYGTTNPPPYVTTVRSDFWTPPARADGTTYYWRIVARNLGGQTPGSLWSFTTFAR